MISQPIEVREATGAGISCADLYDVLRLRSEVLVVEQHSPYLDLDGRDLSAETVHVWALSDGEIIGNVRLLRTSEQEWRIGRVCTAHRARGRGVARRLVMRCLELCGDDSVVIHALGHLAPWYESFGFEATGPMFYEVGIPHVPMRRPASS